MIRIFGHYVSKTFLVLGVLEFLVSLFSLVAGNHLRITLEGWGTGPLDGIWLTGALYATMVTTSMLAVGLYQRGTPFSAGMLVRIGIAFVFTGMAMSLLFYSFPDLFLGRGVMAYAMLFTGAGILVLRSLFFRLVGTDARLHRVLVVGAGDNAGMIEHEHESADGVRIVGYIRVHSSERAIPDDRLVELDGPLIELVRRLDVDELVVAPDDRRQNLPVDEVLDCKMSGVAVLDLLSFFEKEASRIKLDILHPSWIFFSQGFQMGSAAAYGKRVFDIVVSLVLLAVGLPFMFLVALAIMIEGRGRGSVLFHQARVGLDGKLFQVHKFRSMRMDAESDGVARWATKNDSRITRVGAVIRKTRLDELPQLFNVLRGEMSIVGPRPERPEFVEQLAKEIPFYNERHRVKPGLTGWAQLCYQYAASPDDSRNKLEYDLYYVKNASFFLDLIVLLETVEVVLWGKGAH
jgi:sugar transferase (PEP-CTERM system associated)